MEKTEHLLRPPSHGFQKLLSDSPHEFYIKEDAKEPNFTSIRRNLKKTLPTRKQRKPLRMSGICNMDPF